MTPQLSEEKSSSRSCFMRQPPADWRREAQSSPEPTRHLCTTLPDLAGNSEEEQHCCPGQTIGNMTLIWFFACWKYFFLKQKNPWNIKGTHWQKLILTDRLRFSIKVGLCSSGWITRSPFLCNNAMHQNSAFLFTSRPGRWDSAVCRFKPDFKRRIFKVLCYKEDHCFLKNQAKGKRKKTDLKVLAHKIDFCNVINMWKGLRKSICCGWMCVFIYGGGNSLCNHFHFKLTHSSNVSTGSFSHLWRCCSLMVASLA